MARGFQSKAFQRPGFQQQAPGGGGSGSAAGQAQSRRDWEQWHATDLDHKRRRREDDELALILLAADS